MCDERVFAEVRDEVLDEVVGNVRPYSFVSVQSPRDVDLDLVFRWASKVSHRDNVENTFATAV